MFQRAQKPSTIGITSTLRQNTTSLISTTSTPTTPTTTTIQSKQSSQCIQSLSLLPLLKQLRSITTLYHKSTLQHQQQLQFKHHHHYLRQQQHQYQQLIRPISTRIQQLHKPTTSTPTTTPSSLYTIPRRYFQKEGSWAPDPFDPNKFNPYRFESKDYYKYDYRPGVLDPLIQQVERDSWKRDPFDGLDGNQFTTPSARSFTNLMHEQVRIERNLRRVEDLAHREKVFGAHERKPYFDRDYRNLEARQRELLERIYKEQIEQVVEEFERDYAPMVAAQLRSQKRALWWKQMRHRFRFLLYPFSLTWNAIKIAYKFHQRRHDRNSRVAPRLITEAEYQSWRYHIKMNPYKWFKNSPKLQLTIKDLQYRASTMLAGYRELLLLRAHAAQTEMIRFRKYSGVSTPKEFFLWFTQQSKYDPVQYQLRRAIITNMKNIWGRSQILATPKPAAKVADLVDRRNQTMVLSEEDAQKLLLRWHHKLVIFFKLTGVTYAEQPFIVRKSRELIDIWYDVIKIQIKWFFYQRNARKIENRIDYLIAKEIRLTEKATAKHFKDLERAKNPNSWHNIKNGIKKEGSIIRYIGNRIKLWFYKRKNATLYDVAAKNKTYFFGGPAGPPFYRTYLQTKHLLRSPFAHQRIQRLTVGQEDAKSFIRKWSEMNNALQRYPKLRTLMVQAFHDNLILRSSLYFRIFRWLRSKKPLFNKYRYNYFQEFERVFRAIFFKQERYSFQELYAMALNEWWYPTQQSIKKFDRFDHRTYNRYDDQDSSTLFSLSTGLLTIILWTAAYIYAQGRKDYYEEMNAQNEKLLYTQDGADISHYIDGLLYADKREGILMELKYDGIMKLHDAVCSRMGRMLDNYYSVLGDSIRERYWLKEPASTLVYSQTEIANIANTMKGKNRDLELVEEYILGKVQELWVDAAVVYAKQYDISYNPLKYTLEERQEQSDIGHFLMSHIDKICQSASFPELEGEINMSYVIDGGVLKLKPNETNPGATHERVMSTDQEMRLLKYGDNNPVNKFLSLSKAVTYIDHSDDCNLAKLTRLETNFELLVQLLDTIIELQHTIRDYEETQDRILTIPSSDELVQLYEEGKLEEYLKQWHLKHYRFLPKDRMPQDFAELKSKQIFQETGHQGAADHFITYFHKYVSPGQYKQFSDDFGNTEAEFGIKLDPIEILLMETEHLSQKTMEEHVAQLFRPHVNLIIQNINRLVSLRPRLFKLVKDDFQKKFPWTTDLDKEIEDPGYTEGDQLRIWSADHWYNHYHENHLTKGTLGKLFFEYRLPVLMAEELRTRRMMVGNTAGGIWSRAARHFYPKPSEIDAITGGVYTSLDPLAQLQDVIITGKNAQKRRNTNMTTILHRAIQFKDESGIIRNPDNWSTIYDQEIWGFDVDELKARLKAYLQWMTGAQPSAFHIDQMSPTADEYAHLQVTPFDRNSYYDAWTEIYELNARVKGQTYYGQKPKGLTIPYQHFFGDIRESELDDRDDLSLINFARRIPEAYRFKYDTYMLRTYGTDYEFWNNRSLFYSRIDRYFTYFKYHLNRAWSHDILEENSRWKKFKRFITGGTRPESWYEDYFMQHGFRHFLTQDPVLARYGNDFFFRYFIDAPKFDRRPIAYLDRHRYDKDGEDIYFDALYNTRTLNNPYPLHIEHGNWSLKPWHEFVNAHFGLYRYLIVSDGEYPTEYPHIMLHDLEQLEKFIVPDINYGYDAVHSWGKDLFDTTYKKLPTPKHLQPKPLRPNYIDFSEDYNP